LARGHDPDQDGGEDHWLGQRNGQEEIGFDDRAIESVAFAVEQERLVVACGGAGFVVRELEKQVHALPVFDERLNPELD